jgi:hypothetical protein
MQLQKAPGLVWLTNKLTGHGYGQAMEHFQLMLFPTGIRRILCIRYPELVSTVRMRTLKAVGFLLTATPRDGQSASLFH